MSHHSHWDGRTVGLIILFLFTELQIVSVVPNSTSTGHSQLMSSDVLLDIDLLGIAQNNNGSLILFTDTITVLTYIGIWP